MVVPHLECYTNKEEEEASVYPNFEYLAGCHTTKLTLDLCPHMYMQSYIKEIAFANI